MASSDVTLSASVLVKLSLLKERKNINLRQYCIKIITVFHKECLIHERKDYKHVPFIANQIINISVTADIKRFLDFFIGAKSNKGKLIQENFVMLYGKECKSNFIMVYENEKLFYLRSSLIFLFPSFLRLTVWPVALTYISVLSLKKKFLATRFFFSSRRDNLIFSVSSCFFCRRLDLLRGYISVILSSDLESLFPEVSLPLSSLFSLRLSPVFVTFPTPWNGNLTNNFATGESGISCLIFSPPSFFSGKELQK